VFANDLHQAFACFEDGLAALPAATNHACQRVLPLISQTVAAGLAGDEERAVACHREILALTEPGGEFIRRTYCARAVWALGLAAWRRGVIRRLRAVRPPG
jgi:hypothetical protein